MRSIKDFRKNKPDTTLTGDLEMIAARAYLAFRENNRLVDCDDESVTNAYLENRGDRTVLYLTIFQDGCSMGRDESYVISDSPWVLQKTQRRDGRWVSTIYTTPRSPYQYEVALLGDGDNSCDTQGRYHTLEEAVAKHWEVWDNQPRQRSIFRRAEPKPVSGAW